MRSKYTFVNDLLSRGYIRLIKGDNNVVEGMFYLNFRGKNTLLYVFSLVVIMTKPVVY